ncbi:LysM domain-containing protein [Sporosarcina phage Lietuvens]|nr:LysM domain-containing protein [Sporosarcina phage Lietuvens]
MKNKIEFWLKDRYNKYLRLPVNPESIEIVSPFESVNVKVASLGEVSIPGERGLRTFSITSFFPAKYNPTYCEYANFPKPHDWVTQIEKWRDTRYNIRLIIAGTPVSIPCLVTEFTIEPERAGSPGDVYYTMTMTEYRAPQIRMLENKKKPVSAAAKRPAASTKKKKTHTVVRGDSLFKIAARSDVYGSGSQWRKIYDANKKVIGKNPNLIKPGQKLVIP